MQLHPTTLRRAARVALGTLAAGGAACLALVAAPGWAHVSVSPGEAEQGGYTALTFRVPTESDSASTTKVQVYLPEDHPLASVSVKPHPGWHAEIRTAKLATPLSTDDGDVTEAVTRVTWTPDSPHDALKPGEYDDFDLEVGPLPNVSSLTFKTLQTYSDGTVVRWIDAPSAAGQPEPEHPAPTLSLVPASDEGAVSADSPASGASGSGSGDGKATTALALSIVGVLLGGGALAVSLLSRRRVRKP
jgi:periplasmic copper chaperone A